MKTRNQQPAACSPQPAARTWKPFSSGLHLTRVPPKDPKTLWRDMTYSRSVSHEVFEVPTS
jgi:hypothetical protein